MANKTNFSDHMAVWKSETDATEEISLPLTVIDQALNSHAHCSSIPTSGFSVQKSPKKVCKSKIFRCRMCDYTGRCKSHVLSHINSQHIGLKPFKCSYCSFRTAHKQSLDTHLKRHTGIRPYKCQFCLWSATESGQLTIHQRKHTGERPFQCEFCPFKAASKSAISEHKKIHAIDSLLFKCVICNFATRTRAKLQNHMKTHELKYCSQCPYSSRESSEFRNHIKSHKLKCRYCLKMLQDKTKLRDHESTHTNDRKWKCDQCSYNSSKKSLLDKHLLNHHSENTTNESDLLKCLFCSFTTRRPSSLGIHLKSHDNSQ